MPVPLLAIVAGAAGGATMEYLLHRGKASTRDLAIGAAVGAIPGIGLGVRGSLKLGSRVGTAISHASRSRKLKDFKMIGQAMVLPGTPVYVTGLASRYVTGAAATAVLGMGYDRIHSRRGGPSTSSATTSRGGRGATTLSQSARRSVRPGIGKKRTRCSSRSKSGKPCLRPRGHSGRHRYR